MRRSHRHSAFTLVELLVSIAIALLLVLGVNTVFKVTSQTVGAGNSLLTATRDARTIFQTFLADANNVDAVPSAGSTVGDGPFFVIRSEHMYAFRNAADLQAATNTTDPSIDSNIFANFPGNQAPVTFSHFRSHRIDRLGFFSRGVFARQTTANGSNFVATTSGSEAMIYYGHSQQPNTLIVRGATGGAWYDPGANSLSNNSNNYFASDWMLSRMALILNSTATDKAPYALLDGGGLSPFNLGGVGPGNSASVAATTDLAETSIALWGSSKRLTLDLNGWTQTGIQSYSWSYDALGARRKNFGQNWWDSMINYRYQSSPFVLAGTSTPKITPATLSQCAPDLIRGCSSFIVEYAGNFYTKDASGNPVDTTVPNPVAKTSPGAPAVLHVPVPDPTGQVDFFTTTNADSTISRQTRWYGYPRAVNYPGGTYVPKSGPKFASENGDVVPLRDVLTAINPAGVSPSWGTYADAEHMSANFPSASSIIGSTTGGPGYWTALNPAVDESPTTRYTYTAAWGPDVEFQAFPKMIRIIIEVDDHDGRMNQPQRFEFIYDVQQ